MSALLLTLGGTVATAGTAAAAPSGWHTSGTRILTPDNTQFVVAGINWYGFETTGYVAHGLYARDYKPIVDDIKRYGYNTIRIPFSNEMWEKNPIPNANTISACSSCKGKHSRDILANIINYAGSIGLHVILDNHRSTAGNSAQSNGLWYATGRGSSYPETSWIRDWRQVQEWVNGVRQTAGAADTVTVTNQASDGHPTVLGYELRNEPHTPPRTDYLQGATWGTGDGLDPNTDYPNPFRPCAASSTCHDWRLAAERAGNRLLGDAATPATRLSDAARSRPQWSYPLILVNGISQYPTAGGTAQNGPYDYFWWGGNLQGVNGNRGPDGSTNPGAPVLLNATTDADLQRNELGPPVLDQLVYTAHDFGPDEFRQGYFNAETCYKSGCDPDPPGTGPNSSLADVWHRYWAYINTGPVAPVDNPSPYSRAPVVVTEFGTGKTESSLTSTVKGSQGQWFTDLVNFIGSSYADRKTSANASGIDVTDLGWTYWAVNGEDGYGLLGSSYTGLANAKKEYTFLCAIQRGPLAVPHGTGTGQCGSTGALPTPH